MYKFIRICYYFFYTVPIRSDQLLFKYKSVILYSQGITANQATLNKYQLSTCRTNFYLGRKTLLICIENVRLYFADGDHLVDGTETFCLLSSFAFFLFSLGKQFLFGSIEMKTINSLPIMCLIKYCFSARRHFCFFFFTVETFSCLIQLKIFFRSSQTHFKRITIGGKHSKILMKNASYYFLVFS